MILTTVFIQSYTTEISYFLRKATFNYTILLLNCCPDKNGAQYKTWPATKATHRKTLKDPDRRMSAKSNRITISGTMKWYYVPYISESSSFSKPTPPSHIDTAISKQTQKIASYSLTLAIEKESKYGILAGNMQRNRPTCKKIKSKNP